MQSYAELCRAVVFLMERRYGVVHELLFGLLGHTGSLLDDGFRLAQRRFWTRGERKLLEKTLKAGFFCQKLKNFTLSVRQKHFAQEKGYGHYAYGLTLRIEEVLDRREASRSHELKARQVSTEGAGAGRRTA